MSNSMKHMKKIIKDYTPYTKLKTQVEDSFATVAISDYDGSGSDPQSWITIYLGESYINRGGKRQIERDISITLYDEDRQKLIDMLTRKEAN